GLVREHGHEHGEETINNATQRPAVAVPAPAEPLVVVAARRLEPHADEAPVVERVAEARIAGVTHADEETFATLPRHWRDAGLSAQAVIISGGQEPRGLCKHRGGDDSPATWQGPEYRHVTMPLMLPRCGEGVQQALDAPRAVSPLVIDEFEAWDQQRRVSARRLHRARRHTERGGLKCGQHLIGGQPADAVLAQERHDSRSPEPPGGGGRGRKPPPATRNRARRRRDTGRAPADRIGEVARAADWRGAPTPRATHPR